MRFLVLVALVLAASSAQARDLTDVEKGAIADSIKRDLKDPDSAQFKWMPYREDHGTGYCGMINSKNSYGGYTGFQPYNAVLILKDGVAVSAVIITVGGSDTETKVAYWGCGQDGYPDLDSAK